MMNKDKIVSKFIEYVKISSPSYKEADFAEVVKKDMEELGFEVILDKAGEKAGTNTGNLIGFLKGNKDVEPIMFCAQMDTVTPCENISLLLKMGL